MAEAPRPAMTDAEIRAILGQVAGHAADMRATGVRIEEKVDACVNAVRGMRTELDDVKLEQQRIAPMRQKAITFDDINNPAPRPSQAVTSAAGIGAVSLSPLEAEVSKASVHAIANAVPAARKENRTLSLVIAALIVLAQAIQIVRGH